MYFGNNGGLLEFDGTNWKVYATDNQTIVCSVTASQDGKIYAGGQGTFGYFLGNSAGSLTFHSLLNLIPEVHRTFDDVWDIEIINEEVFFRASGKIFHLVDEKIDVLQLAGSADFLGQIEGKLYASDKVQGLYYFNKNSFQSIPNTTFLSQDQITSILPFAKDTILLTTLKQGIFSFSDNELKPWKTEADNFLKDNQIYSATLLPKQRIAIGTSLNAVSYTHLTLPMKRIV